MGDAEEDRGGAGAGLIFGSGRISDDLVAKGADIETEGAGLVEQIGGEGAGRLLVEDGDVAFGADLEAEGDGFQAGGEGLGE